MEPLVSGEGVVLDLPLASPGVRAAAALLDLIIQFVLGLLFFLILSLVGIEAADDAALAAVAVVGTVLIFGGYPVVWEWATKGRTVGKIAFGLRVVRDDAGPIGFRQALVRGISSLVLEKPGILIPIGTALGLVTATSSASWKRIGDLLAGTIVVQDRALGSAAPVPLLAPHPALAGWAATADLRGLDGELAVLLRTFVGRASAVNPGARAAVEAQLANRVVAAVSPPPPPGVPAQVLLVTVLAERQRRGLAALR